MLTIKKYTGFKMMPEGENLVTITKVQLQPPAKPVQVCFEYVNENGATLKETLNFRNEIALDIIGKRCDVALNGALADGTPIEEKQLPEIFLGKKFIAVVKHVEKGDKTYANISYLKELVTDKVEDDL